MFLATAIICGVISHTKPYAKNGSHALARFKIVVFKGVSDLPDDTVAECGLCGDVRGVTNVSCSTVVTWDCQKRLSVTLLRVQSRGPVSSIFPNFTCKWASFARAALSRRELIKGAGLDYSCSFRYQHRQTTPCRYAARLQQAGEPDVDTRI